MQPDNIIFVNKKSLGYKIAKALNNLSKKIDQLLGNANTVNAPPCLVKDPKLAYAPVAPKPSCDIFTAIFSNSAFFTGSVSAAAFSCAASNCLLKSVAIPIPAQPPMPERTPTYCLPLQLQVFTLPMIPEDKVVIQ